MNQENNCSHLVQLDTKAFRESVATHETEWNHMYVLYKTLFWNKQKNMD